jgi:hypothetical protein
VFNELCFNLESFNPAFAACLLMVRGVGTGVGCHSSPEACCWPAVAEHREPAACHKSFLAH